MKPWRNKMATEGIGPAFKSLANDMGTLAAKPVKKMAKGTLGFVAKLQNSANALANRIGSQASQLKNKIGPSPETHLKDHFITLIDQVYKKLVNISKLARAALKMTPVEPKKTKAVPPQAPLEKQVHFATTEAESKERYDHFIKDYDHALLEEMKNQEGMKDLFVELEKEPRLETRLEKIKTWMESKKIEQSAQTGFLNAVEMFWKTEPPVTPIPALPKQEATIPKESEALSFPPRPPLGISPRLQTNPSPVPTPAQRKESILKQFKPTQAAREPNLFYKNTQLGQKLQEAIQKNDFTKDETEQVRAMFHQSLSSEKSDEEKAQIFKTALEERFKNETNAKKTEAVQSIIKNIGSYIEHNDLMPPAP